MRLLYALPWVFVMGNVGAQRRGEASLRASQPLTLNDTQVFNDFVDDLFLSPSAIDDLPDRSERRKLVGEQVFFEPLNCNGQNCSAGSSTWKRENYNAIAGTVIIPCGKCVTMDYNNSDTLVLPFGIDIQGTLRFPDGYRLTIVTPFVRVQGNLEMFATRKVTNEPDLKFILTGVNEQLPLFIPADQNRFACSLPGAKTPALCSVGRKPFLVAGGKVTIQGLPNNCPTWVNLEDISYGSLPAPTKFTKLPTLNQTHSNPRCRTVNPYMDENFTKSTNPYNWTGGTGASTQITPNGTFLVTNRTNEYEHGPVWNMLSIRNCLIPDQTYLFRARIRLMKAGSVTGTRTTCATSGTNCVTLQSTVRTSTSLVARRKGWEEMGQDRRYGLWQNFYAIVTYASDELNANATYQILQIRGPEVGVDIEIDDVRFSLPSASAVPNPNDVCGGNLVLNGDAELDGIQPYPIDKSAGYLSVRTEPNGNRYFRLYGRRNDADSVIYKLDAPGCLVANGKYKVSARIRIDSDSPINSRMRLRGVLGDGSVVQQNVADCPASSKSSWVLCESEIIMNEALTGASIQNVRLQFETFGAANSDMNVDDMSLAFTDGPVTSIIVPDNGLSNCWDKGAEILLTSHTLNYDAGQVRRLVSSPTLYGIGFVKLEVDSVIIPPTTRKESSDFAIEVALLSRNIVFEGASDDTDLLFGAHFMVMRTPRVAQYIEGVEFRNFGQQGLLGRYPIHFHLCGDVKGAIVSKNSIRKSNQRCVVVHGTHNLTIADNVSYDNFGHCFMTEDGGEINNIFRGNLGAQTKPATRLVSSLESDNFPSTFWCSNPQNEWNGNVAAGSSDNGFWFELQLTVRGPTADMPLSAGMNPRTLPLSAFRNNTAHSNGKHGLRTYPQGFMPSQEAIFYNTRSYKNKMDGIFFHNSRNLSIDGGVLADNMIQADFDRADNMRIKGAFLIGISSQYKEVLRSQPSAPSHAESIIGLQLHGFTLGMERDGVTIQNITFSGFSETASNHSALIEVDNVTESGHFDYWSTVQGVRILDDVSPAQFDFSRAKDAGITDIYLTDLDSSMRPRESLATGVSTVIMNTPEMTRFIDVNACKEYLERAYMYCEGICLRTVLIAVNPAETEGFTLRVTKTGDPSYYVDLIGKYYYERLNKDGSGDLDKVANTLSTKSRYFAAALPPGNYTATFRQNNELAWPTHAEITVESAKCPNSMSSKAVALVAPDPTVNACQELIRNGDFEMSSNSFPNWLHYASGLELVTSEGIDGSNAIADTNQTVINGFIGQYLDTRCLDKGRQYEIRAWVKLKQNGTFISCDAKSVCPAARLRIRTPTDESGSNFTEFNMDLVEFIVRPYRATGWNVLQGTFTIDSRIAAGASVLFFVERRMTKVKMYLDNVSIALLPAQCNELVLNGNFADGTSKYWGKGISPNSVKLSMVTTGGNNTALAMTGRTSLTDSPIQNMRTGCMVNGDRYMASARVRLINGDNSSFACDPTRATGDLACPFMKMRSFVDIGLLSQIVKTQDGGSVAATDHGMTSDGWYVLTGILIANDFDARADKSELFFDQVSRGKGFIIDDVSVTPLPMNCTELILNGNAEYSETPSFWRSWIPGGGAKLQVISLGGSNHGFKVSNRNDTADGMHQLIDPRCMMLNSKWKLTAKMKVVNKYTGVGVTCDPIDTNINRGCPPIRIASWSSGVKITDERVQMTNRPIWVANSTNLFAAEFTVNSLLATADRVSISFRTFNLSWDLIVDDVSLAPA